MDEKDEGSDIKLDLGLGLNEYEPVQRDNLKKNKRVFFLDLSIPLHQNDSNPGFNSSSSLKFMQEDEKMGRKIGFFNGSKDDDDDRNLSKNCGRKKLRLTKDQTTLLEDSFEQHSTLTMAQKQLLAEKLNLKPRQVEVWFQNRRARTKLKQTEIDCDILKKHCERLSEENRQLKKQVLELQSAPPVKIENPPPAAPPLPPFFNQMPKAAALNTCPSCEKIWNGRGGKQEAEAAAAVIEVVHED